MCASGKATQHTIRRCTIRKIIKTEFLSPRVFIDFSYCASRRLGKINLKNPPDGGFFDFTGGDDGMCASGKATQHTIRRCTIRKIIKTEFLSPRVFIDFSYCASRRLGKINLKNPPDGGFFDFTGYDTGCVRVIAQHKIRRCTTQKNSPCPDAAKCGKIIAQSRGDFDTKRTIFGGRCAKP